MGRYAFPRSERLTRADEIQALFRQGARVERPSVLLLWRQIPGPGGAGFAVSGQVQGAARRNRARRRVREAYRVSRHALPDGIQVVVVARARAATGPYREILRDMREGLSTVAKRCRRAGGA